MWSLPAPVQLTSTRTAGMNFGCSDSSAACSLRCVRMPNGLLLMIERAGQGCAIGSALFACIHQPYACEGQRTGPCTSGINENMFADERPSSDGVFLRIGSGQPGSRSLAPNSEYTRPTERTSASRLPIGTPLHSLIWTHDLPCVLSAPDRTEANLSRTGDPPHARKDRYVDGTSPGSYSFLGLRNGLPSFDPGLLRYPQRGFLLAPQMNFPFFTEM